MYGYVCVCRAMSSQCRAMYSHVGLCMAMYACVGLCMAM